MSSLITGKRGWTRAQEEFLMNNIGKRTVKEIAEMVGKGVDATKKRLHTLRDRDVVGYCHAPNSWSVEDEEFLLCNHTTMTALEVARSLNKTLNSVVSRAVKMEIQLKRFCNNRKTSSIASDIKREYPLLIVFDSTSAAPVQPNRDWSDEGIEWLIKNYQSMSKHELAVAVGKSVSGVENKLRELRKVGLISGDVIRDCRAGVHHGSNF